MIIDAFRNGETRVPGWHDPDSKRLVSIIFRPDTWEANKVYEKRFDCDYDAVMPTTYKGLYFIVKCPGKSGSSDPFTGTYCEGDEITDGTITWIAKNYNLMRTGVTVSSVAITCTDSVTTSSKIVTTTTCDFFIDPLPVAFSSTYFNVTLHTIYSNNAEDDYTLKYMVAEL